MITADTVSAQPDSGLPGGEDVLTWLSGITELGLYGVMSGLAAGKAIFPPLPSDTLILLVATLLAQAGGHLALALVATCMGAVAGVVAVYETSRRFGGGGAGGRMVGRALRPTHTERLARLQERYGIWAYFLGRFMPGIRHVMPVVAGASGAPRAVTLVPICVATLIWYAFIVLTGGFAGDGITRAIRDGRFPVGAVLVLALAVVTLILLRRWGSRLLSGGRRDG